MLSALERPALSLVKIPSGDAIMVGRMLTAQGVGPHPTVVLLHGFPGTQLNLDIATALQRQGWNVLVFNYRGAWGSQGTFSFANALEDVQAALSYLRQLDVAAMYRIDTERLALVGHSMGGFLACMTAARDQGVKVCASLSGFNFGLMAGVVTERPELKVGFKAILQDATFFLSGTNGQELVDQVMTHGEQWNLLHQAQGLTDRPFLLVGALYDEEGPVALHHVPLVRAMEQAGAGQFTHLIVETDHNYTDKRMETAELLHHWLEQHL